MGLFSPQKTLGRIGRSYRDPGGVMKELLGERPGEERLFAYLFLSCLVQFSGTVAVGTLINPAPLPDPSLPNVAADRAMWVAATFAGTVIFVSLMAYALAALYRLIARAFGGQGGWYESRLALFWSSLVLAPVYTLYAVFGWIPRNYEAITASMTGLGALALLALSLIIILLTSIFGLWLFAHCYASAFGFRNVWKVMLVILGLFAFCICAAYGVGLMI